MIHIRRSYVLHGGWSSRYLMHGSDFIVHLSGEHKIVALLGVQTDQPEISNSGTPVLTVAGQFIMERTWLSVLQGIAREEWPKGFTPNKPNDFLFNYYPLGLQTLCDDATAELTQAARRFLGLMRWRFANSSLGPPDRITWKTTEWSIDEHQWEKLRYRWDISAKLGPQPLSLSPERQSTLEELTSVADDEPLSREIWYTAKRLDDSRAQVILAVTAVEVGIKRLISDLVPDAAWLATNASTPPIVKMLKEYIPTLPGIDQAFLPTRRLRHVLDRAVVVRNNLVHVGRPVGDLSADLRDVSIEDVLQGCSDLLWLLDIYRGHTWAADHLSSETRDDLGLSKFED